ncbi:hypothetical protein L1987_45779 [Smallanthus sonchifolius]|uniref:Uncharacterized protein n=1 Tax=Smallanthus sonchifolius TaxID=185202 RepID=A0ACB9FXE3_9ASTR|nr:hypothetical protein L1987_45779 [Smallanthus sonchifolius]
MLIGNFFSTLEPVKLAGPDDLMNSWLLVEHFFQSLVNTSGITLHIRQLAGKNSHHIIEATFKAFARALRQATEYDPRRKLFYQVEENTVVHHILHAKIPLRGATELWNMIEEISSYRGVE